MNKSVKKLLALLLSVLIIMSSFAVVFSCFAADDVATPVVDEEVEHDQTTFFSLFITFVKEIGRFFKYIFYDVYLGRPAPTAPSLERVA